MRDPAVGQMVVPGPNGFQLCSCLQVLRTGSPCGYMISVLLCCMKRPSDFRGGLLHPRWRISTEAWSVKQAGLHEFDAWTEVGCQVAVSSVICRWIAGVARRRRVTAEHLSSSPSIAKGATRTCWLSAPPESSCSAITSVREFRRTTLEQVGLWPVFSRSVRQCTVQGASSSPPEYHAAEQHPAEKNRKEIRVVGAC